MVKGLAIELYALPFQTSIPDSAPAQEDKDVLLGEQIQLMLQQGIVEPASPSSRAYVSHMFLRPKTDGSFRPILNLSELNEYTVYRHFKMDHLCSVMRILPQGSYMASIDITSAYFAIPVKCRDRDLLQFKYHGKRYRYTCLPNGYSPGPRVFTRIMKALLSYLRVRYGVNLVFYIDDTLIYGDSFMAVQQYVSHTLRVLQQAGFTISWKKSVLGPTQSIDYLGFTIDSTTLTLTIPGTKVTSLVTMAQDTLTQFRMSIRHFAGVVGRLAATDPGNDRAKVHIKVLQRVKQNALTRSQGDYESTVYLSSATKACLREWIQHIPIASAIYAEAIPQETVYTDSSKTGWGCYWVQGDLEYGEEWPLDEQELHINILELKAVLVTLKFLKVHMARKLVHFFIDNTTAISCIRKGGSNGSYTCNEVTEYIYRYAWNKGITFKLAYCPTKLNVKADRASRAFTSSAEWTLSASTRDHVFGSLPAPHIDLFATAQNKVCEKYVSLNYEVGATATDAFTLSWNINAHLFPPFSLIGRVLRKVRRDRTQGTLVVPDWKTQPWYSDLTRLRHFHKRVHIPIVEGTLKWPGKPHLCFPLAGKSTLLVIPI